MAKFAKHLPTGKGLDAVFVKSVNAHNRLNISAPPSHELIVEHWGALKQADRSLLAGIADNPDTLEYITDHMDDDIDVALALLKNRKLPHKCIAQVLELLPVGTAISVLYRYKNPSELALICSENTGIFGIGTPVGGTGRQGTQVDGGDNNGLKEIRGTFYEKCGRGAGEADDYDTLRTLEKYVPHEYRWNLLKGLLESDCGYRNIDIDYVCDLMVDDGEDQYSPRLWSLCGKIAGSRGYASKCINLLGKIKSPDMRAAMFAEGIPLVHLLRGLDVTFKNSVLAAIAQAQRNADCRSLNLQDTRASSHPDLAEAHHSLKHDQEAVNWLVANADSATVGATVWQSQSDHLIATVLRSNAHSHLWASKHIWKLNTIWPKLGVKHKKQIADRLTDLHSLPVGAVRDWVIEEGPDKLVRALVLKKNEIKKLVTRLEDNQDITVAWIVAMNAERPKDRTLAAVAGMRDENWTTHLPTWLNSAGSGEIVKLWQTCDIDTRSKISEYLIASLRGHDDTLWVDQIIGGITAQWNKAPDRMQEAAAHWLNRELGENTETWDTVLSLYSEWYGTLESLRDVVKNL